MFECFFPDAYMDSTYVIDFEKLYKEGIRGVIFDIDNTLVPHGAPADERAIRLFARLRSIGLDYCLISNNQLPRVKPFADAVQAKFVEDAHKPSRKNYLKAMKLMHVDLDSCIFVGDQIFTDVYGAKRCGMYDSRKTPSSQGGDSDCSQALSGENRALFLSEREKIGVFFSKMIKNS